MDEEPEEGMTTINTKTSSILLSSKDSEWSIKFLWCDEQGSSNYDIVRCICKEETGKKDPLTRLIIEQFTFNPDADGKRELWMYRDEARTLWNCLMRCEWKITKPLTEEHRQHD